MCYVFFFFSSRRRHTRWTGDWSSDVCSSDLCCWRHEKRGDHFQPGQCRAGQQHAVDEPKGALLLRHPLQMRSEERRVGKECRSMWWPYQFKKKRYKSTKTLMIYI